MNKKIIDQMTEDLLNLHYKQKAELRKGVIFGGWHEDDIKDLVSRVLWRYDNESITLKINKDPDEYHISVEIVDIEESNKKDG